MPEESLQNINDRVKVLFSDQAEFNNDLIAPGSRVVIINEVAPCAHTPYFTPAP